jgi:hypothetical protein
LYRLEREHNEAWRLWIALSPDGYGTYLILHNDGSIKRVTLRADGEVEEHVTIKRSDGFQ